MTVFSRIVDVDNFGEVVLNAVRDEEKRELEHRLGILNVQNPIRVSEGGLLTLCVTEKPEHGRWNDWCSLQLGVHAPQSLQADVSVTYCTRLISSHICFGYSCARHWVSVFFTGTFLAACRANGSPRLLQKFNSACTK